MNPMKVVNDLPYKIIGCAYKVHKKLGPGLLESTYEICLQHELIKADLKTVSQLSLPITYDTIKLDAGYRVDLLVEDTIILELKATQEITPIHKAQLMTYLKLSELKLGLILNFNVINMQDGIKRVIM